MESSIPKYIKLILKKKKLTGAGGICRVSEKVQGSVAVLAGISFRSPRKLLIFTIKQTYL